MKRCVFCFLGLLAALSMALLVDIDPQHSDAVNEHAIAQEQFAPGKSQDTLRTGNEILQVASRQKAKN